MKAVQPSVVRTIAWTLSSIVAGVAIVAWGQNLGWHFRPFSMYNFFPLFGLLAFSFMWTHFIMHAVRLGLDIDHSTTTFWYESTSLIVLVFILMHPGLLVWQLWHDGFGLPPGSTFHYVGVGSRFAVVLGMISLGVFLCYEFRRLYRTKPWWKYLRWASNLAMAAIFYHALVLGAAVHGWFRIIWFFYGCSLLLAIVYASISKKDRKVKA